MALFSTLIKIKVGKYSQYKVELATLKEGKFEQDFECGTEFFKNMENPDILNGDVHVHMDGEHKADRYYLSFHCEGVVEIPCDRCLDPIEYPIDAEYKITVEFGDEYNDASDELLIIPHTDRWLNVAYMLYDTIVLSIPLRHVHPLGKCNRAMAAALNKHRAGAINDEETEDMLYEVENNQEEPAED